MRVDRSSIRTMEYLQNRGYYCVKSGGSFGLWDVVAFNKEGILLIQAKANQAPRPHERAKLRAFTNYPANGRKEVWIWHKRARQPVVKGVV